MRVLLFSRALIGSKPDGYLALESLYGGQITLSNMLIKPNIRFHFPPPDAAPLFFLETNLVIHIIW